MAAHVDASSAEPLQHCQLQPESELLQAEASLVSPGAMTLLGNVEWLQHGDHLKKQ